MSISSLFQFIIGFFIGIIFFTAGIAGGAYFFLTNVDQNPEKQIFAEEKEKSSPKKQETKSTAKPDESKTTTNQAVEEKKKHNLVTVKLKKQKKKRSYPQVLILRR